MRSWFVRLCALIVLALPAGAQASCAAPGSWERWERFRAQMITAEGRVIDRSDPRLITTSEGQSYALFFALVDNDRALFRKLLGWTERHLAQGDLTSHLPSWLWGRQPSGLWGVLDENSASDSDLWIAYSLLEAGRLWDERSYTVLGTLLLQRMLREETADLPGLGRVLLPGAKGFVHEGRWRLNPSYVPPQLVSHAAAALPDSAWRDIESTLSGFLVDSAPKGLAPDWISWTPSGFKVMADDERVGSYDAIRVYLWVGMMDRSAPLAGELAAHFSAITSHVSIDGIPPERFDVERGTPEGKGPPGFSAALLPLSIGSRDIDALRSRVRNATPSEMGYYNQALTLFGEGWDEGRYRFGRDGALMPQWETCK